ncbi:hypothetical protein K439DRAFT_1616393 [Ramaria rubella]|nr:hypothetical protein K439DRAFT_1616393 [Ramaria rubella]
MGAAPVTPLNIGLGPVFLTTTPQIERRLPVERTVSFEITGTCHGCVEVEKVHERRLVYSAVNSKVLCPVRHGLGKAHVQSRQAGDVSHMVDGQKICLDCGLKLLSDELLKALSHEVVNSGAVHKVLGETPTTEALCSLLNAGVQGDGLSGVAVGEPQLQEVDRPSAKGPVPGSLLQCLQSCLEVLELPDVATKDVQAQHVVLCWWAMQGACEAMKWLGWHEPSSKTKFTIGKGEWACNAVWNPGITRGSCHKHLQEWEVTGIIGVGPSTVHNYNSIMGGGDEGARVWVGGVTDGELKPCWGEMGVKAFKSQVERFTRKVDEKKCKREMNEESTDVGAESQRERGRKARKQVDGSCLKGVQQEAHWRHKGKGREVDSTSEVDSSDLGD